MFPCVEDHTEGDKDHGIEGAQVEVEENGGSAPAGSAVPRGQPNHQPVYKQRIILYVHKVDSVCCMQGFLPQYFHYLDFHLNRLKIFLRKN